MSIMNTTNTGSDFVQADLPYRLDPAMGGGPSLEYAGTVSQHRQRYDVHSVQIHDMRNSKEKFELDKQGFELVQHVSAEQDFTDVGTIKSAVYAEVQDLLKKVTGATRIKTISHLVRRNSPDEARNKATDLAVADMEQLKAPVPSNMVHVDHSESNCIQILKDNVPEAEVEKLSSSRWAIMNVWRPIKTVSRDPLCLCDARSVSTNDLFPHMIILPSKGSSAYDSFLDEATYFELLKVRAAPEHKWYYASSMEPNEALIFKVYDSTTTPDIARRVPHTSFQLPGTGHVAPRESIEFRNLVFWEN